MIERSRVRIPVPNNNMDDFNGPFSASFLFCLSTGNACSVQNDSFTITTGLGAYSIEHYSSVNNESVKILAVNFHCFQV